MKLLLLIPLAVFFCFSSVKGQNTLRPNIYFNNMNYYNPSAGISDTLANYSFSVYGKRKFVDNEVWKKPTNIFVNHIGKLEKVSGFYSASYIYDSYSFYDRQTLYGGYAHQFKLPGKNVLSIGARGIFNFDRVRWDALSQVPEKSGSSVYFNPDLDLGIQYQVKGFTLGVSSKNIFSNSSKVDGLVLLKNQREWYSNISYAFNIKDKITIAPYALFYAERKAGIDVGAYLSFYHLVNVSYLFRLKEFRHVYSLGVNVYKGLNVGVAMDHSSIYRDKNLDVVIGYRF